jgi:ketosteroid isomerase-like protein
MTDRGQIERVIKSLYEARLAGNVDKTLSDFAEDGTFAFNARGTGVAAMEKPITGKAAVRAAIQGMVETWRFDDWRQVDLLIDGERALLHWTADIACIPTGKHARFDVLDLIRFESGRIVHYYQHTDTALMMRLTAA